MIPRLQLDVLTDEEIDRLHGAMVRILSRTGLAVESEDMRRSLAADGAQVDRASGRVRYAESTIEGFLGEAEKVDRDQWQPRLGTGVGIYQGWYLDPVTGRLGEFTPGTLSGYVKLAQRLEGIGPVHLQNLPTAAARRTEPLELRLFAWQHGANDCGSIQLLELCPFLLEMQQIRAESLGVPLAESFRGQAYLVSPLRVPAAEAAQVMWFREHGLRVHLGNMVTAGGTGPVTLAGAVALNLAECVAIGLIHRALFGERRWAVAGSITPLDMRTLLQAYGRPEMALAGLANLQLARHYRVPGHVHAGLTDAKRPTHEAAAQKLLTAWPCILAGGARIEPGLLSIDEVFSPIQMILDAELVSAIQRVLRGFAVDEETLAVDLIDAVGPGGLFTDREHTVRHFRREQWEPRIWSRHLVQGWLTGDCKVDTERALDRWHAIMASPDLEPQMTPEVEQRLWEIIGRARRVLG